MSAAKSSSKAVDVRLDEMEDEVTDLRERVSAQEAAVKGLTSELHGMRGDIQSLRRDVISTFGRAFLLLVLLNFVAVGAISSIVGGQVYLSGLGVQLGASNGKQPPIPEQPEDSGF